MEQDPFAQFADPFAKFVVKPGEKSGPKPVAASEPDTYLGGVLKSLKDQAAGSLRPIAKGTLDALPGLGAIAGGALSTPETLGAGTIPGMALGAGVGRGARDLIGHVTGLDKPTTPLEKAAHIGVDTAETAATAALMPGVETAVRSPMQTMREGAEQFGSAMPPWIRRLGKLIPTTESATPSVLQRPGWQTWPENAAQTAKPNIVPIRPQAAPPGPWSADELASFQKQGLKPEAIDKLAQQMGRAPQAAAAPALEPIPIPPNQAEVPFSQPAANAAAKAEQEAAGVSRLQQPRVDTGAQRVGRAEGLTKEQVRARTVPISGEAQGEASNLLPKDSLGRIIDDMKALPKEGSARADYVARASSGKTQQQVETLRRILEHLGLVAPLGVGTGLAARDALTGQMGDQ